MLADVEECGRGRAFNCRLQGESLFQTWDRWKHALAMTHHLKAMAAYA